MKYFICTVISLCFLCFGCIALVSCEKENDEITEIIDNYDKTGESGDSEQTGGSTDENTQRECPACGGDGECQGSHCDNGKCSMCGGTGYEMDGKYKFDCPWCDRGRCPACHGSCKCNYCHGRGYIY